MTETAAEIDKIFFEIIIAPGFSAEALEILKTEKEQDYACQESLQQKVIMFSGRCLMEFCGRKEI